MKMRLFFLLFVPYLLEASSPLRVVDDPSVCEKIPEKKSFRCFFGGDVSWNVDSFRSLPDGSWNGNTGVFGSFNVAYPICKFGVQVGSSFGVYNFDGKGSTNTRALGLQSFVTAGAFGMNFCGRRVNTGIALDAVFNRNYGVFNLDPTILQVRSQTGYLVCEADELGVLTSFGIQKTQKYFGALPVTFKAINQCNLFWSHFFCKQGKTTLWAGIPFGKSLMFPCGRPGKYIVGASFKAPLTACLSIEGHSVYMGARGKPAFVESRNYAANVSFGLTYSFGSEKDAIRPYLPLANNSNFLVDTNVNY